MARIVVCGVQTLYAQGGAELLVETLSEGLRARGHQVDTVNLPFSDVPRTQLLQTFLTWRMLNLREIHGQKVDLLIATKYPSYAAVHPNKVVWLVHQHRQAYDLYRTVYSDMHARPDGQLFAQVVRWLDAWSLREARRLYAISGNVAARLQRYNGLQAQAVYPPPKLTPLLHCESYEDFVLAPGRFEPIKRFELVLRALAAAPAGLSCYIVGDGLQRQALEALAGRLGLEDRVRFLGRVDDATLVDLYAHCLGVIYPPYDEDYGYVTVEAFLARKLVVTTTDAGGVLEFVEDGVTGFVGEPTPAGLAVALTRLWDERASAPKLGDAGYQRVQCITWDAVLDALTSTL